MSTLVIKKELAVIALSWTSFASFNLAVEGCWWLRVGCSGWGSLLLVESRCFRRCRGYYALLPLCRKTIGILFTLV